MPIGAGSWFQRMVQAVLGAVFQTANPDEDCLDLVGQNLPRQTKSLISLNCDSTDTVHLFDANIYHHGSAVLTSISGFPSTLQVMYDNEDDAIGASVAFTSRKAPFIAGFQPVGVMYMFNDGTLAIEGPGSAQVFLDTPVAGKTVLLLNQNGDGTILANTGKKLGFFGTVPVSIPTVTGVKVDAVAASLVAALAALGLIVDMTT